MLRLGRADGRYQFYLWKGDDDANEKFLQPYCNVQRQAAEIMYRSQLARVIRETAQDQNACNRVAGACLGKHDHTLRREQLADKAGAAQLNLLATGGA